MRHSTVVALAMCAALGCGSSFSVSNPLGSSGISVGDHGIAHASSIGRASSVVPPKNAGTQVWMVPPPGGDLINAVQHPELWQSAQDRVDVFSFYFLEAYDHPGFECGVPCGPNTYHALVDAVPGGAFRWVQSRGMAISFEAGSVKEYSCTPDAIVSGAALPAVRAIKNIEDAGATVSYISQDEPFAAGLATSYRSPFGNGQGCNKSSADVAQLVKAYVDTIHQSYPNVQIGLVEPYPHFSVDEIMSYVLELEHAGVAVPFFHLDMDLQREVREKQLVLSDLQRLRDFFQAKGIPFGVIIWGADGRSNDAFASGAWATLQTIAPAVGVTEHTILESWAENPPGNMTGSKTKPDVVPESDPMTMSGMLLRMLEYLRVRPVS